MSDLAAITRDVHRKGLPEQAAHWARLSLLDASACILSGQGAAQVDRLTRAGLDTGAPGRAFALGTAAHALDFDDYEDVGSTHPGACIAPALLALAEGQIVTLDDMLVAYVQGYETILAFGQALGHDHYLAGWHATGTIGTLGATSAAARLLGLGADETAHALSVACTMASGLKRQFGSDIKALHAGLAARNGVEAALIAQSGMTGRMNLLDGPAGLLTMLGGRADTWPDAPQPRIEGHPPFFKPWPCCAYTHRSIEAAEHLATQVQASKITAITLDIPTPYAEVAGHRAPHSEAEARFSNAYCIAAALQDGAVTLASFDDATIAAPALRRLEAMVEMRPYPLHTGAGDMSPDAPDTVTLTLKGGASLSHTVAHVRGGPGNPLSEADLTQKFTRCGGQAGAARHLLSDPPNAAFNDPIRMPDHDPAHSVA